MVRDRARLCWEGEGVPFGSDALGMQAVWTLERHRGLLLEEGMDAGGGGGAHNPSAISLVPLSVVLARLAVGRGTVLEHALKIWVLT